MRRIAVWTSVATIVALNIVIGLGLLNPIDTVLFGGMLAVLHVVLPVSSILMLVLMVKERHWAGAAVFAGVVIGMLVVLALDLAGVNFSRGLHLVTDVCALNIYLIVVPWYISRPSR